MITVPLLGVDITEGERIWIPPSQNSSILLLGYHVWAADEAQNPETILLIETSGSGQLLAVAAPIPGGVPIRLDPGIVLPVGASIMATLQQPPQLSPVLLSGVLWGEE